MGNVSSRLDDRGSSRQTCIDEHMQVPLLPLDLLGKMKFHQRNQSFLSSLIAVTLEIAATQTNCPAFRIKERTCYYTVPKAFKVCMKTLPYSEDVGTIKVEFTALWNFMRWMLAECCRTLGQQKSRIHMNA